MQPFSTYRFWHAPAASSFRSDKAHWLLTRMLVLTLKALKLTSNCDLGGGYQHGGGYGAGSHKSDKDHLVFSLPFSSCSSEWHSEALRPESFAMCIQVNAYSCARERFAITWFSRSALCAMPPAEYAQSSVMHSCHCNKYGIINVVSFTAQQHSL